MKKRLLSILIFIFLLFPALAHAISTKNCDYLTGGDTRALDYYSVSDLNNGDRAIVVYESGISRYYGYFKYDASGTTAENTSAHPYYIRPNDYVSSGVWYEVLGNFIDLNADLTIANLTVTGTNTVVNLDASGRLSGALPITDLNNSSSTPFTISGTSLYGGQITNLSASSEVTAVVAEAQKGMSAVFTLAKDMISGSTIWVQFNSADKIINSSAFVSGTGTGTSYYYLSDSTSSGVTSEGITLISPANNQWIVYEQGSPTRESIE